MAFLNLLRDERLVAVLRGDDPAKVRRAAETLIDSGIGIIELTLTVPGAFEIVRDLSDAPASVGIGTITAPEHVDQAVSAGAAFLVSPGISQPLLEAMRESGMPALPGVQTPSEVMQARTAGFDLLKLFHAGQVGAGYISAVRGPFPELEFVPSGGISDANAAEWLDAGAVAVGLGSLARPHEIAAEDWSGIREHARAALRAAGRSDA
ncbi:bifunctional 4-hydroxy-2-oxoglutarate aldolase/2-dehydro-3-deoxy-phosphogluconate aldolase [Leucobacter tenebrionis]|uniref:bifunctional 4-hydroxy-2-oxoglutarate aldolase/2-dehydro-3-deoxy-phosphogluconate aldolase n=1 Tax=Leucobacter tenebrionis TaxID=2873270 RepID=UPI001CA74F0E|nr:bifunctional 4-hydroxy-2-oxoglutarate aldolase/2-dehydro-3-deoxy-phosphogluconate aldolase [Leucobacter tenebrionis]QZY53094.1 bifunctional 4-hydroxy-2-oxoglutarate aldolase/2-dehydro-3-deoxy-phosphogluconate aldolase [Leucobacter tenebrionis]